jgi:polysaccharide biosynthesis protein PslH
MKILWVNPNFLHPTTKGGQIRTLEMLRRLHRNHEVHYATLESDEPEGEARVHEYASKTYVFPHRAVSKRSPAFLGQVLGAVFSPMPLAISRHFSPAMKAALAQIIARENFDAIVCDFLVSAPHFENLRGIVLFQHNVETMIWRRHTENSSGIRKRFFRLQAERMFRYEQNCCQDSSLVIAVSREDADTMRTMFGINHVADIPTGVDLEYFKDRGGTGKRFDLVFVGSMDWLPNVDGIKYFIQEILPIIRRTKPDCSLVIAGRSPHPSIQDLAAGDPNITLTGTVPDIRPYLWESSVSIVPLRIGGGTRLKIYESIAAGVPVVSTTIGAEGLPVEPGRHLLIGDDAESFAAHCCALMSNANQGRSMAVESLAFIGTSFSWEAVTHQFERLIANAKVRHNPSELT